MITAELAELVRSALVSVVGNDVDIEPAFERPRKREHGDWATNVALVAAKGRGSPRDIAARLVDALPPSDLVDSVEVAGPGFLNFHLAPAWLHDVVRRAASPDGSFGRSSVGAGQKVNVEYVSANPTGPVNVVSGRHAAVGDVLANLLAATGYEVTREFYVNDAGRQMTLFAQSIDAHYMTLHGHETAVPEEGYHGAYVADLARDISSEVEDELVTKEATERLQLLREAGLARMLERMRSSLERFGTTFDVWFLESTLRRSGEFEAALDRLRAKGLLEEREGALWFLSSSLGDEKDRVVIKKDGEPTYLASDLPYLLNKFERGFDHVIYLWGADHHGTVARLMAAAEAFGIGRERVEILLTQMVNLTSGSEKLRSSKRAGNIVELDEVVDEVGPDATRYTFLTRSLDQHLDFDIDAVKREAPENPVYYVQYAHARISSILRKAAEEGRFLDGAEAPLTCLSEPAEDTLMRKLATYEEVVPEAAALRAPQRITRYVEELASTFSAFYRDCKVISDDEELTQARLALCVATRSVIADALGLLGVSAPEKM